jgi:phosphate transporter
MSRSASLSGHPQNTLEFSFDVEPSELPEATVRFTETSKPPSLIPLSAAFLFAVFYSIPILESRPTAHSTLAILITVTYLWSTEGFPGYATAYLVPILAVWLGIGIDPDTHLRLEASKRATAFAQSFMDPVVFVFLGSMTITAGLAKMNISDRVSNFVFVHLSRKPHFILLTLMLLNVAIGAFLSSIASTALILTFSLPIIRSLDPDDPFIRGLLFGMAWSGNCAGMATCIASPQNLMALRNLQQSWNSEVTLLRWSEFGIPIALTLVIIEWAYLCLRFRPRVTSVHVIRHGAEFEPWSLKHTFACGITVLTIVLWALESTFPNVLGHIGITSLIPVIAFFGSGLLGSADFQAIRWPTISLMGGGLALGEAMKQSKLLDLFSEACSKAFASFSPWPLLVIVLPIVGVFASLLNSTAAAAILYPPIGVVGDVTGHSDLFVCLSAMMVSGAQLFHMSSFGNALVFGVHRHLPGAGDRLTAEPFLAKEDFPKNGWPTLVIGILIIASVGYGICWSDPVINRD